MKTRAFLSAAFITMMALINTRAALPLPETLPPSTVGSNQAVLQGYIIPSTRVTYVAFQVRRAGAPRWAGRTPWQKIIRMETFAPERYFSANVSNLAPDTDYEVRAIALVAGIRRHGGPLIFHTSAVTTLRSPPR